MRTRTRTMMKRRKSLLGLFKSLKTVEWFSAKCFLARLVVFQLGWILRTYLPERRVSVICVVNLCSSYFRDQHEQCKRAPEKQSRSVKVFRCQLPRINAFYKFASPSYDGSDKPLEIGAPLCTWCGTWKGNKTCSSCKTTRYCSEKHQAKHVELINLNVNV